MVCTSETADLWEKMHVRCFPYCFFKLFPNRFLCGYHIISILSRFEEITDCRCPAGLQAKALVHGELDTNDSTPRQLDEQIRLVFFFFLTWAARGPRHHLHVRLSLHSRAPTLSWTRASGLNTFRWRVITHGATMRFWSLCCHAKEDAGKH